MTDDKLVEQQEFRDMFDNEVQSNWTKIMELIRASTVNVHRYDFSVDIDPDILNKFGLNKDIDFLICVTITGGKATYYYKGVEIEPDCYYVRPNDYHEVTTLQMLQEAIRQDTNKPDIKYLENGEKQLQHGSQKN